MADRLVLAAVIAVYYVCVLSAALVSGKDGPVPVVLWHGMGKFTLMPMTYFFLLSLLFLGSSSN